MIPTAKPATTRPPTRSPTEAEAVWRMTPTVKRPQAITMDMRRPMASAKYPAKRAPKKVPADRIEVINDLSLL